MGNDKMIYKKADITDIDRLSQFRKAYMTEEYKNMSQKELDIMLTSLPQYFKAHLDKDFHAFIAIDENGENIGSLFLIIQEKPASPRFPTGRVAIVMNVYTAPQYRRKGVASALVKMMLNFGKTQKLDHIELRATKMGEPLYKKHGFVEDTVYRPMKFYF